ncbi:MAG: cysteine desulfurase family protein, partial [Candidatus Izemoplasmatales bacterium]|nr:cysteine desulfurase family protein [Candidatus Izemoplasmatales bacterium]
YSATTPVDRVVLGQFYRDVKTYYANPNSQHALGKEVQAKIARSQSRLSQLLAIQNHDVIYTSGATEANNLALLGWARKHQSSGMHLITSPFEHPSVTACFSQLVLEGYEVDVLSFDADGRINLEHLAQLIRPDTTLVSIGAVSSELGISQDVASIHHICANHPHVVFHSDVTQAVGKIQLDLNLIDLFTLSAHKFYGMKGIGALIKRHDIVLEPVLFGGSSASLLRPGTPPAPLIISLTNALDIADAEHKSRIETVSRMHELLVSRLKEIRHLVFNSNQHSIKQIVNISLLGREAKAIQEALSEHDIFVSTQTACATKQHRSEQVFRLSQDEARATSSIRISLSHLTTESDIDQFVTVLKKVAS